LPLLATTRGRSVQHRFGGALNLKFHVNALVIDGAFSRDGPERATFHPVHPPDVYALEIVIDCVYRRLVAWLGCHGLLTKVDDEVESQRGASRARPRTRATTQFA